MVDFCICLCLCFWKIYHPKKAAPPQTGVIMLPTQTMHDSLREIPQPYKFVVLDPPQNGNLHPGRLTWNLQITFFRKEHDLPNLHEDMFHVNLQGCKAPHQKNRWHCSLLELSKAKVPIKTTHRKVPNKRHEAIKPGGSHSGISRGKNAVGLEERPQAMNNHGPCKIHGFNENEDVQKNMDELTSI